jgi:hypothetical protein
MNEPELKDAAYALAAAQPRHLDQPTTPPIHWREENGLLRVLMADGRTVRGPLPDLHRTKQSLPIKAPALMALPARDPELPPANLKANGKRKPANHKAGS